MAYEPRNVSQMNTNGQKKKKKKKEIHHTECNMEEAGMYVTSKSSLKLELNTNSEP